MYAIVKSGGKQYRVERGQQLLIERLPDDEGASVALEPILYRSEEAIFDRDGLGKVKVTAKVLGHVRGQKLRVFKFKPKRGYKRRTGHRQELTRIEVTDITAGSARAPRARRADASAEAPAKAPRRRAAKPTKAPSIEPAETPKAKATEAAKPKATEAAKAKATEATEARAPEVAEAKAREATEAKGPETTEATPAKAPKPKRAKKSAAAEKESSAEEKANKETGEDSSSAPAAADAS
jgi:large subunit ribosomal protein L21